MHIYKTSVCVAGHVGVSFPQHFLNRSLSLRIEVYWVLNNTLVFGFQFKTKFRPPHSTCVRNCPNFRTYRVRLVSRFKYFLMAFWQIVQDYLIYDCAKNERNRMKFRPPTISIFHSDLRQWGPICQYRLVKYYYYFIILLLL